MRFTWRDGFHPPKGVAADDVGRAIQALPEPSPEHLLQASSQEDHVLHDHLWSEGDQIWARRGRSEECRKIISSVKTVQIIGGQEIKIRAFENLSINGGRVWLSIDQISQNDDLRDAYIAEIEKLQLQAAAKMKAFREFLKD